MFTPEQKARKNIDNMLKASGWDVQTRERLNLGAKKGVALCEFKHDTGRTDYTLFVDRKALGVIEAKKEGTTLSGVEDQTGKYGSGFPKNIPHYELPLPYLYESTGVETFFTNRKDPEPRARRVFSFHRPETLREWIEEKSTLRHRLRNNIPVLSTAGLWDCQFEAITNLEESFASDRPKALIQMATGSGKTYTAVSFVYRLIKFANAKRILFLVDRGNLGRQALREFQQYVTPDDGRKFTELYNVQHLKKNSIDSVSRVCISTIQRVYSILRGEREFNEENEETSLFEISSSIERPVEVVYNESVPVETFDFIITDECHRSIYNLWRQVLEYFDAYIIGLTATPAKHTIGFFDKNLVMEYSHEKAVADRVNVGYDVYRIKTKITEKGSTVDAGFYIDKRDKLTRKVRQEYLDDDLLYSGKELDRSVVSHDQIRTVVRAFKEKLFTDIFPGRKSVPKTLVFAKDDSHAEDIVRIVREEFGKGNDFCKKITYKTEKEKPDDILQSFRNSYNPRIAVTVDMIATGTDVKPLECLLFLRDVRSANYFEQMKGRGTRTIEPTEFQQVTNDAKKKTHFVIVDAVGVCESDKTDSRPLERKPSVSFEKLLNSVAVGIRDDDTVISLASRLSRLDKQLSADDQQRIIKSAEITLSGIVRGVLDSVDPDIQIEKATELFNAGSPANKEIKQAREILVNDACAVFDDPDFRKLLVELKKKNEQVIDTISIDEVISAEFDGSAKESAGKVIENFKQFIADHMDSIEALNIIYNKAYKGRHATYAQIKELAGELSGKPYLLTAERVWAAYEQLEKSRVRNAGPDKLLTDIISLIRFSVGDLDELAPFSEIVDKRFSAWLEDQKTQGRSFTAEQLEWLNMIKDHIAASVFIDAEDFEFAPFKGKGGVARASDVFGDKLGEILEELNGTLVA